MSWDIFRETLVMRPAFGDLVGRVCPPGTDSHTVPVAEVRAGLNELGLDRFAGLLLANRVADSMDDALIVATELRRDWLAKDRRPRTMTEIMTPEGIERAFARREPWWKRLRTRVSRALIADEEESARLSAIDLEVREREGKAR